MVANINKLKGKIKENMYTMKSLASELGICETSLRRKINEKKAEFTISESWELKTKLKLSNEEYNFLKNYTTDEESRLNSLKTALNDKIKIDEVEARQKAIPVIENCLNEYYSLDAKDKHTLIGSIIDKITYEKSENGRWNIDARSSFKLELFLKI